MPRATTVALTFALALAGTNLGAPLLDGSGHAAASEDGKQSAADGTVEKSLDEAWSDAVRDWNRLQDASADAWGDAKAKFQESWSALRKRLDEAPPSRANETPSRDN